MVTKVQERWSPILVVFAEMPKQRPEGAPEQGPEEVVGEGVKELSCSDDRLRCLPFMTCKGPFSRAILSARPAGSAGGAMLPSLQQPPTPLSWGLQSTHNTAMVTSAWTVHIKQSHILQSLKVFLPHFFRDLLDHLRIASFRNQRKINATNSQCKPPSLATIFQPPSRSSSGIPSVIILRIILLRLPRRRHLLPADQARARRGPG